VSSTAASGLQSPFQRCGGERSDRVAIAGGRQEIKAIRHQHELLLQNYDYTHLLR
jgi:hypothetical protein